MQRSAEVEQSIQAVIEAMRSGDADGFSGWLSHDLTEMIGTDDTEWWDSYDATVAAEKAQMEATGGFEVAADSVQGYAVGDIGWFASRLSLTMSEESTVHVRLTGVVRREDGEWRMVQVHLSVGTPNDEIGLTDLPK